MPETAAVGVIMGSQSDWETMRHTVETLEKLGINHETRVISAHRTPARSRSIASWMARFGRREGSTSRALCS